MTWKLRRGALSSPVILALVATGVMLASAMGPAVAEPPRSDFNGDRFDDLAIGVPYDNLGNKSWAGAVNVLYGSAKGLTAAGDQLS
jgi:hypothetical protein